jgi:hypothetical protein
MTERTLKALADEIIADLPEKIDLIYISQGDKLTDEQVGYVVAGDITALWDSMAEWEYDAKWSAVTNDIKTAAEEVTRRWERDDGDDADYADLRDALESCGTGDAEWERIRDEMESRESGDWFKDLMNGCSEVLLRINVIDEDAAYNHEEVTAERVLADVKMPNTIENRFIVQYALDNASPEYSVLLGYWIVGASVSDLWALPEDCEVEITDPYLYLGNPFMGDGFITEEPIKGTVRVKREDLRTDKTAFGYGVSEIYGGLSGSQYSASIKLVTSPPTQPEVVSVVA